MNEGGAIEIPGVCFEDGIEVKVAITVRPGVMEVGIFPIDEDEDCDDLCEACRQKLCGEGFLDE